MCAHGLVLRVSLTVQTRRGKIDQVEIKKEKKKNPVFVFLEADHNLALNKQNTIGKATQGVEGRNVGRLPGDKNPVEENRFGRGTRRDLDSLSYISYNSGAPRLI